MAQTFDDFVPDVGGLAGLVDERVVDCERWLLIGVSGRVVVRKSWVDACEVSEGTFRQLLELEPVEPDLDAERTKRHKLLMDESRSAQRVRCGHCAVTKGDCAICDRTRYCVPVEIELIEDKATSFAHVFVPEVPHRFWVPLAAFLGARSELPECLSFPLGEEQARVDAYRGRRGHEEYRGHRLGKAVVRARQYVERLQRSPSHVALRHTAHAWPFALVVLERHGDRRSAVAAVDEQGKTSLIG